VVGVFVNHDVVAVPIPAIGICKVKRSYAEVKAAKPETSRVATLDVPAVSAPETALKAPVYPGVVKAEMIVIPAPVMTDPLAIAVDVGSFGMIVVVAIGAFVPVFMPVVFMTITIVGVVVIGGRTVVRNVSADVVMMVVSIMVVVSSRESRQGEDQGRH
jgi:hypothetical protein